MPVITIATSITPNNFYLQRVALDSWIKSGFKVISLNSATESAVVAKNFPDIPLTIVSRTAEPTTGKPYIFFDDVLSVLSVADSDICGIINSDILLKVDSGFADFVAETVGTGFLFGSRIDVDSVRDIDGEKFIYGFDYFFFKRPAINIFPSSVFCLGVPWWDYWALLVPIASGLICKELISPIAFHVRHETKWAGELFDEYGKIFYENIGSFLKNGNCSAKTQTQYSKEQITIFSYDVLSYILDKSTKVIYPKLDFSESRVLVGCKQYLSMRSKVIENDRRIVELYENIRLNSINVP